MRIVMDNVHPGHRLPPGGDLSDADQLVTTRLGEFLSTVFTLLWRNKVQIALLSLIPTVLIAGMGAAILAPIFERGFARLPAGRPADPFAPYVELTEHPALLVTFVVLLLAQCFAGPLQWGSVFVFALRSAAGQPVSLGEAARVAASRLLPLVGWTIALAAPAYVGLGLSAAGRMSGLPALVAPGFWIFFVASYAATVLGTSALIGVVLVERGGIPRAWALLKNHVWPAIGRYLLLMVIVLALILGLDITFGLLAVLVALVVGPVGVFITLGVAMLVMSVVVLGSQAAFGLVSYTWLRHQENPATSAASLAAELPSR
jgi:hypothetical protein